MTGGNPPSDLSLAAENALLRQRLAELEAVLSRMGISNQSVQPATLFDSQRAHDADDVRTKMSDLTPDGAEPRLRQLAETVREVLWLFDMDAQRLAYISPAYEHIWGRPVTTLTDEPASYINSVHREDQPRLLAALEQQQRGEYTDIEYRVIRPDGSVRWVWDRGFPICDPSGRLTGVAGIAVDITARRDAEAELREQRNFAQSVMELMGQGLVVSTLPDWRITYANSAFAGLVQRSLDEILGRRTKDFVAEADIHLMDSHGDLRLQGLASSYEIHLLLPTGETRPVAVTATPYIQNGAIMGAIAVLTDLSEQRRQEEVLRTNAEQLQNFFDNLSDVFISIDVVNQRMILVSPACERVYGVPAEQFRSDPSLWLGMIEPDDRAALEAELPKLSEGKPVHTEHRIRRPDGRITWVECKLVPVLNAEGKFVRLDCVVADITTRKLAAEEQSKLTAIIENSSEFVGLAELDGAIVYVNKAGRRMCGLAPDADVRSMNVADFVPPSRRSGLLKNRLPELYATGHINGETEFLNFATGTAFDVDLTGFIVRSPLTGEPIQIAVTVRDITERKAAERALQQRTHEYESLVRNLPDIILRTDADQRVLLVNPAGLDALGQPQEAVVGRRLGELGIPSVPAEALATLSEQQRVIFEASTRGTDGETHYLQVYCIAERSAENATKSYLAVARDITELRNAQADLEALNRTLEERVGERTAQLASANQDLERLTALQQAILDGSDYIITSVDTEGIIRTVNRAAEEQLGYSAAELVGAASPTIWHVPEELASVAAAYAESASSVTAGTEILADQVVRRQRSEHEWTLVRRDGSRFPALVSISAMHEENGQLTGFLGIATDITARKAAETALQASEQRLQFVLSQSPAAIFTARAGSDYGTTFVSDSITQLCGFLPKDFLERASFWSDHVHPDDIGRVFAGLMHLSANEEFIVEYRFLHKNGAYRWIQAGMRLILDDGGQPAELIGYLVDVNDLKEAEQALRRSRDELRAANLALEKAARLKDEFLASMSHELRTPLTGVIGMAEALQLQTYGALNDRQLRATQAIWESGQHLLTLINDILDLSKIEAGQMELQLEEFVVEDVCQGSIQLVKGMAHRKQQPITFSVQPTGMRLRADPRRLKQVLVNLLSNAVKFTPEGGKLGLTVTGDEEKHAISFTVWDKGIGIAEEDMARLFQPFTQLDASLAREHSGTGLGLALVLRMTELHGGSVSVKSTPQEGSEFTITLPWKMEVAASRAVQAAGGPSRPLRQILIVGDQVMDTADAAHVLNQLGVASTIYPYGFCVVNRAAELLPSVILLNLDAPELDNEMVIEAIKTDERTSHIPVILSCSAGSRNDALAAGADGYLPKPFTLAQLEEELTRMFGAATFAAVPAAPGGPVTANRHLLLAEDNETTIALLVGYLETLGYQVDVARNGQEALEAAHTLHPALILMDVQMPKMDGLEAIQRIRATDDGELRQAPIIALTALAMPGDRERCLRIGATDYMAKPAPLVKLGALIHQLITNKAVLPVGSQAPDHDMVRLPAGQ